MNKYKQNVKGIIINIKHGASKEGQGWRSIVYFKGCNFYCPWCGSPESIPLNPRTHKKLVQKDNKQILDNIKKRKNPPGCALLRGVAGVLRVLYNKSKKVSIIVSKFYLIGALANNLINCQEKKFDPISPSQITFLFLVEKWVSVPIITPSGNKTKFYRKILHLLTSCLIFCVLYFRIVCLF